MDQVNQVQKMELVSLDNPVFSSLVFCCSALLVKMLAMALLTAVKRIFYKAFVNSEDATSFNSVKDGKPVLVNSEAIERVRRNHLNDLENIPAFVLLAFLYTLTGPDAATGIMHFRVFTVARFLHTVCYQFALPQPSRALSFAVGIAVCVSMAVRMMAQAAF